MKLDDIQKFLVALEDCDLSDKLNLIQQVKQLNDIRWFFCNDQCITNIQFAGEISKEWDELLEEVRKPLQWEFLGSGKYGSVCRATYKGNYLAIKVPKNNTENPENTSSKYHREAKLLGKLSHQNIIGFRGMSMLRQDTELLDDNGEKVSLKAQSLCIIMEYLSPNLEEYVLSHHTFERPGLSFALTWELGKQITSAVHYLHGLNPYITHRDIKPDNILLNTSSLPMQAKLADFGLALSGENTTSRQEVMWIAPEQIDITCSTENNDDIEWKPVDVYKVGLVIAFMLSAEKPCEVSGKRDAKAVWNYSFKQNNEIVGQLGKIYEACCNMDFKKRSTAEELMSSYVYFGSANPYLTEKQEFFSCGFLTDTHIYVADSCIKKNWTGYFNNGTLPESYKNSSLVCTVINKTAISCELSELQRERYESYKKKYSKMCEEKKITNNPILALQKFEKGYENIVLSFKEVDYVHHRSMRDLWIKDVIEAHDNNMLFGKLLSKVDPNFSTSFGLHVAVLTNEGPNCRQKFIFPQRSKREGMATMGVFICGAVESCSKKDFVGDNKLSLIETAARGLQEELAVELSRDEFDAICLSTLYLKFDTHEWGMCGFVNLKDERIAANHQLSFPEINGRFSGGPAKDKFENEKLVAVDFELETMVSFVREHYSYFASSAKLVVVKVLEAFFGVDNVKRAFDAQAGSSN